MRRRRQHARAGDAGRPGQALPGHGRLAPGGDALRAARQRRRAGRPRVPALQRLPGPAGPAGVRGDLLPRRDPGDRGLRRGRRRRLAAPGGGRAGAGGVVRCGARGAGGGPGRHRPGRRGLHPRRARALRRSAGGAAVRRAGRVHRARPGGSGGGRPERRRAAGCGGGQPGPGPGGAAPQPGRGRLRVRRRPRRGRGALGHRPGRLRRGRRAGHRHGERRLGRRHGAPEPGGGQLLRPVPRSGPRPAGGGGGGLERRRSARSGHRQPGQRRLDGAAGPRRRRLRLGGLVPRRRRAERDRRRRPGRERLPGSGAGERGVERRDRADRGWRRLLRAAPEPAGGSGREHGRADELRRLPVPRRGLRTPPDERHQPDRVLRGKRGRNLRVPGRRSSRRPRARARPGPAGLRLGHGSGGDPRRLGHGRDRAGTPDALQPEPRDLSGGRGAPGPGGGGLRRRRHLRRDDRQRRLGQPLGPAGAGGGGLPDQREHAAGPVPALAGDRRPGRRRGARPVGGQLRHLRRGRGDRRPGRRRRQPGGRPRTSRPPTCPSTPRRPTSTATGTWTWP